MSKTQVDGTFEKVGRFVGGGLIVFGMLFGALDDKYAHGCFDILVGVLVLYCNGWRPEVKR